MGLKVIGANFGRTATMSLKQGLEILGFKKCYHMSEVVVHPEHVELWLDTWRGKEIWKTLFAGYQAAVDWPAAAFWPRLMHVYPEAKIVLSIRDADEWFESARKTIFRSMDSNLLAQDEVLRTRIEMLKEIIIDGTDIAPQVTWGTSPQDVIPITGIVIFSSISAVKSSGTHSSNIISAPASSNALASSIIFFFLFTSLP